MKLAKKLLAAVILAGAVVPAIAAPIYVNAWNLYSGEAWSDHPPTYTAQEAAARLFGGVASDYLISTVSANAGDINEKAWYDQYGIGVGLFAQDYRVDHGDLGKYDVYGDTSAMIMDSVTPPDLSRYVNYAFRVDRTDVPEPLSLSLMGLGLAGLAAARRRKAG